MDPSSALEYAEFSELEAYAAAIELVDARLTAAALPERQHWSIRSLVLPGDILIQSGDEGCAVIAEGTASNDGFVFYTDYGDALHVVNGVQFGPDSMFILPPGAEFCIAADANNRFCSTFIPNDIITAIGGDAALHAETEAGARVVGEAGDVVIALRSLGERFFNNTLIEPRIAQDPASLATFREELLTVVAGVLKHTAVSPVPAAGRPSMIDPKLIAAAAEVIDDEPSQIITMADLVEMTGLSERTLRNGFKKFFGVAPQRYIQLRRLQRAHSLLSKAKQGEVTVSEVAAELGMWDMGRFATRYRALFGERPSETLRN